MRKLPVFKKTWKRALNKGSERHHHKKPKMIMDHLLAKISAAVESGDITQEQADAKLADIDAKRNARTEKMSAKLESIKAEIAAAVQNGDLTQEEADEKITHFQEKMENGTMGNMGNMGNMGKRN